MTDLQLIEEIINGKTDCFAQLVFRYEKQLMRFLRIRCYNRDDAEDVFQETFLNAHLYLQSYDNRFAFSTWLFNIALNLIKKHHWANNKISTLSIDSAIDSATDSDCLENYAFKNAVKNENSTSQACLSENLTKDNIWTTAKNHLNDEQLSLLWFTYAEDYSGSDVAIILERSLPWVKINLIRVKSLLKTKLIEKGHSLNDLVRG